MYRLSNLILMCMYIKDNFMKYLLSISLSLCFNLSYSQVYKYKAFNTYFSVYDETGKFVRKDDSTIVDFLVVINFKNKKINTYGKRTGDIDLVSDISTYDDKEGNTWVDYDAVDGDGEKCKVQILIFKDQTQYQKGTLYIDYPKARTALVLRLRKDD